MLSSRMFKNLSVQPSDQPMISQIIRGLHCNSLVYRLQGSLDAQIIFELHCHYLLRERLEDPAERKDGATVSFGSVTSSVVPPSRVSTHENIS